MQSRGDASSRADIGGAIFSVVVGAATFFVLTAIGIVNWSRRRKDAATLSANE